MTKLAQIHHQDGGKKGLDFGDLDVIFKDFGDLDLINTPEHEVLMVSYCGQSMSVVRRLRAASTIALKAYSSYTPGPIDSIVGRNYRGDL